MDDADALELNERFARGGKPLEPDMLAELQSMMRMHSLSAEELYWKWESYCLKMDLQDVKVSVDGLRALKRDIQDALERENRKHATVVKTDKRTGAAPRTGAKGAGGDVFGMLEGMATPAPPRFNKHTTATRKPETPSASRIRSDIPSSSPGYSTPMAADKQLDLTSSMAATSFNDRPNPGEVVEVLNDHLRPPEPPIAPYGESRIKLTAASDQKKLGYKPLAMKASEASEILDDRIDDFLGYVKDHYKLEDSEFGSAASQSTTEIYAVGRIASDSAEGKLNAASLVLETSRRTGGGRRIPLNVQNLRSSQFFPGQIVAFKGKNTSGQEFTVQERLEIPLLPNAASSPAAIEAHREKLRGGPDAMESDDEPAPLNVIFGSGPYTADDNLDFEPLHAICSQAADTYADALVLSGPFIDIDHPLIASGDFDLPEEAQVDQDTATMSTVFRWLISPALQRLHASNPSITILLVPSVRDVIAKHVSWPQDPFPRRELGLPKSARVIGNPMTLSLNEAVLAISSQDALWELRHEELAVGPARSDAPLLSRLARHLLEQRHYFPLFPPVDRAKLPRTGTADGLPTGAMLDTSYLRLGDMVNVRPDVMIVPSALPPFAKVVESVLVINPGSSSKRKGPGTYARMTLYPPTLKEEEMGSGAWASHRVFERARVEITRV